MYKKPPKKEEEQRRIDIQWSRMRGRSIVTSVCKYMDRVNLVQKSMACSSGKRKAETLSTGMKELRKARARGSTQGQGGATTPMCCGRPTSIETKVVVKTWEHFTKRRPWGGAGGGNLAGKRGMQKVLKDRHHLRDTDGGREKGSTSRTYMEAGNLGKSSCLCMIENLE